MTSSRPSVFVGSSVEGLKIARTIQIILDYSCEVTIWSQGVSGLGSGTLESLVCAVNTFDFAILILTPDDLVVSRESTRSSARDNVLFELGFFIGALGSERTFIVHDRKRDIHLPSDLAGITCATFEAHDSGNLKASLGAPCGLIEELIETLGPRKKDVPQAADTISKISDPKEAAGRAKSENMSRSSPLASISPGLMICHLCGKVNKQTETFVCLRCKKTGLCLEHLDKQKKICTECAEKINRERLLKREKAMKEERLKKAAEVLRVGALKEVNWPLLKEFEPEEYRGIKEIGSRRRSRAGAGESRESV